jgi:hypothetical protein
MRMGLLDEDTEHLHLMSWYQIAQSKMISQVRGQAHHASVGLEAFVLARQAIQKSSV